MLKAISTAIILGGCIAAPLSAANPGKIAVPDKVGKNSPIYKLYLPGDRLVNNSSIPKDTGTVAVSVKNDCLQVSIKLNDSDVIALGKKDQLHHNELGDVCEIFLKPVNKPYYWELFITPKNKQSSYFWYKQESANSKAGRDEGKESLIVIKSAIEKTKNGWNAEVSIPIKMLEQRGDKFVLDGSWSLLIARQNFNGKVAKTHRELSSFPQIIKTNFHSTDEFVRLVKVTK